MWQRGHDSFRQLGYTGAVKTPLGSILLVLALQATPVWAESPLGWKLLTSAPRWYQASRQFEGAKAGRGSGLVQGVQEASNSSYALLAQKISAADYRGRRVRLSAYLRSEEVRGRTGLWLRVDGPQGEVLFFDNMRDRPLVGDLEWSRFTLECEVAPEAVELHYGLLLQGSGRAQIDELKLEVLGISSATVKARAKVRGLPRAPLNGDFER